MIELLCLRDQQTPDSHAYTFLIDGKKETPPLTYAELDQQAKAIAALLQKYQARGERALLLYPQGLEPRFRTSKSSIKYYKPGVNN